MCYWPDLVPGQYSKIAMSECDILYGCVLAADLTFIWFSFRITAWTLILAANCPEQI